MLEQAAGLVDRFTHLRALVIGDAMLDRYWNGLSHRLCQEAPVPIVDIAERWEMPGGAANCAVNLAQLGATVELIGRTGADCEGDQLRELLVDSGVSTRRLQADDASQTLSKTRVMCEGQTLARCDQGSTAAITGEQEDVVLQDLAEAYAAADLVVVSDYGYGVMTPRVIHALEELQARWRRPLAVDSKRLSAYRQTGMTLCKPNFAETLRLLGLPPAMTAARRWNSIASEGEKVLQLTGSQMAAITLDREGALIFERGRVPYRTFARSAAQKRTSGAGDTYLSTFGLALAAGATTPIAAEIAAAAAAVVVGKEFTATCSRDELRGQLWRESAASWDLAQLLPSLQEYRRRHRQIVLTNGCFDILHRGHISYLEQARELGDVLIVGVNTDESIRRLKGPSRPINSLADRVRVLSALSSVDHVVAFGEDTPHRLIEAIRPDVFVKGGDYTREKLPEAELVERLGGTVKILPFLSDRSTTGMISRICRAYGESSRDGWSTTENPRNEHDLERSAAAAVRTA